MSDYGHRLEFGTFLTPSNQDPEHVLTLAKLTEQAGLDLASFQDHPYQAAYLDTWTLMSWVLAQTSTLRVASNVLNLPLRPPAVLARSAASLDLLSGGRYELGIGAGSYWDAIKAFGGPKREPGESVDALGEAIDVIRAIWDTSERGGVYLDNRHYRVWGAKRGPEPPHPISIWVGARGPRLLRLIGEKADGWITSIAIWQGDWRKEIDDANRRIDEGALRAGRDPREIRRLVNLPRRLLEGQPRDWAVQLVPFAVDHGLSTFFITGDDPDEIAGFGRETASRLRELVEAERAHRGTETGGIVRGPKVLALRREEIDYDDVPAALSASAVEPGDRGYGRVRSTYVRAGEPGLLLRPGTAEEVSEALLFARRQPVALAVRSGGHGLSGKSTNDGGIVIDLGRMNRVEVLDASRGRVRVEAGARWGHVAQELGAHGLAMSSGDYGDVGAGGLATAGGIGFFARRHGLTIDSVWAVEVVLADGCRVRAGADTHPELFWALRGAGGNFGIVTAFELDAYAVREVVFAPMSYSPADAEGFLQRWGDVVESSPRELTSFLYMSPRAGDEPVVQVVNVFASSDTEAAVAALTPLANLGSLVDHQAMLLPYSAIVAPHDAVHRGSIRPQPISNGFAVHLGDALAAEVVRGLKEGAAAWVGIRSTGGAVNDVAPEATAFAHRHQNFNVSSFGSRSRVDEFRDHWDALRRHTDGLYTSFESDDRAERVEDAFPGPTLDRLRPLKAMYDPDNVFTGNLAIEPVAEAAAPL